MGVKNTTFYKTTEHFVERAHERFGIQKDAGSAMKFFRQNANHVNYSGQQSNKQGKQLEVWQNDDIVFILDPSTYSIITTYPTDFLYQEERETTDLKDSVITNIERSIDNEIYNEYLGFVDTNEESIIRASELMKAMRGTKRRDYRERQIAELQGLLSNVVKDLELTNVAKNKLEGVKQSLAKR